MVLVVNGTHWGGNGTDSRKIQSRSQQNNKQQNMVSLQNQRMDRPIFLNNNHNAAFEIANQKMVFERVNSNDL